MVGTVENLAQMHAQRFVAAAAPSNDADFALPFRFREDYRDSMDHARI